MIRWLFLSDYFYMLIILRGYFFLIRCIIDKHRNIYIPISIMNPSEYHCVIMIQWLNQDFKRRVQ